MVRGGYAIFHDSSWNQGAQGLWQNPPYYAEVASEHVRRHACRRAFRYTFDFPARIRPISRARSSSQNTDFKQGRIQQFNVNVEQQIPGQIVLTAGYAGSRASHILVFGNNINVGSPSACGTVTGYTLGCGPDGAAFGVPYPAFPYSDDRHIYDIGQAHYNSLQIKAETKSARYGIYGLIGYTYSRSYDTGFRTGWEASSAPLTSLFRIGKTWIGDFRRSI